MEGTTSKRWRSVKVVLAAISGVLFVCRTVLFRIPVHASPPDVTVHVGSSGWELKLRSVLGEHGYAHVPMLVNRSEAQGWRDIAFNYCYGDPRKALPLSYGGYSVPGWLDIPEFASLKSLLDDTRLHTLLKAMFGGDEYRFASHNDVGCDFVGVWHKDILRGDVEKFQECDVWSPDADGEKHEIYKVLFYLQDHDHDEQATKVIPGSHVLRRTPWETGYVAVHPKMGDAVIIDQRISHAGNHFYNMFGSSRLFVQTGWGRKNRFTDEFERGTIARQQTGQSRMLKEIPIPQGIGTILKDIEFSIMGAIFTALPPQLLNYFADKAVARHAARSCSGTQGSSEPKRDDL